MWIIFNLAAMAALCVLATFLTLKLNRVMPSGSKAYWIGAIAFVVFARVLEPIFLGLIGHVEPADQLSNREAVLGILLACVAAGLFEETGKWLCFAIKGLKSNLDLAWLAKFALGYALCEAIMLGVVGHAQLLYLYSRPEVLRTLALDAPTLEALNHQLANFTEWTAVFLLIERIFAVVLQLGLTLLSALAVARKQIKWLMVAIFVHAFLNIPAASFQYGVLALPQVEMIYASLLVVAIVCIRMQGASLFKLLKSQFENPLPQSKKANHR